MPSKGKIGGVRPALPGLGKGMSRAGLGDFSGSIGGSRGGAGSKAGSISSNSTGSLGTITESIGAPRTRGGVGTPRGTPRTDRSTSRRGTPRTDRGTPRGTPRGMRQERHEGVIKEINTHETFEYNDESGAWSNTGKYQKTVLYEVLHPPAAKGNTSVRDSARGSARGSVRGSARRDSRSLARRTSILNRRGSTESSGLPLARTSKQAFTEKAQELDPSFRGRKGSMLRLGGRRTSITSLLGCGDDESDDDELYDRSSRPIKSPRGSTPRVIAVKSALERSKEISKKSAKFHYCWTGNNEIAHKQKKGDGLGYGFGYGYQRDKKNKNPRMRRRRTFVFEDGPDMNELSQAYSYLGYNVQDVSELTYLYHAERASLQKLMIKAVYTGYIVTKFASCCAQAQVAMHLDATSKRLSFLVWMRWQNHLYWDHCKSAVDVIKWVMKNNRHTTLQKALYTAMQNVRKRIVKAQSHWRWMQVRKQARQEALIRYCLKHEFTFLEQAAKIPSIMGTRMPYQMKLAVERHYNEGIPFDESTIFSDEMRRDMFKHSFRTYTKLHRELYDQWQAELVPHVAQVIMYANNGAYDERQRKKNEESPFNNTPAAIEQRRKEAERKKADEKAKGGKTAAEKVIQSFTSKLESGEIGPKKGGSMLAKSERTRFDGQKFFSRRDSFQVASLCVKSYTVHKTLQSIHGGMYGVTPPPMFTLKECYPSDQALFKAFKGRQTKGTSNIVGYISSYVVAWYEHHVLKLFEGERLWEKCRDENNELYYHNKKTGETVREKPENIDALLHDPNDDDSEEYSDEDEEVSELSSPAGTTPAIKGGRKASRKPSTLQQGRKSSRKPSRKPSELPAMKKKDSKKGAPKKGKKTKGK